jgi:predicted DNA-binding protein with PD1-like motif
MATMNALPLRLNPGDDLRAAIEAAVAAQGCRAAFVLAGIGSLAATRLRFAGAEQAGTIEGDVEILSLSGSVSSQGAHLHISVSDAAGRVLGGHVAPGCTVRTTAELLLALLPEWDFTREPDARTGYSELVLRERRNSGT